MKTSQQQNYNNCYKYGPLDQLFQNHEKKDFEKMWKNKVTSDANIDTCIYYLKLICTQLYSIQGKGILHSFFALYMVENPMFFVVLNSFKKIGNPLKGGVPYPLDVPQNNYGKNQMSYAKLFF